MNNPSQQKSSGSLNRRTVLAWGSAGAAGGLAAYLGWTQRSVDQSATAATTVVSHEHGTAPGNGGAVAEQPTPPPAGPFSREAFLPHLNTEFTLVHEGDSSAKCRLIEISPESRITGPKQTYSAFTITFESNLLFLKDGGICKLSHPQMETLEVFLSPVGRPGKTALLEAAFTIAV